MIILVIHLLKTMAVTHHGQQLLSMEKIFQDIKQVPCLGVLVEGLVPPLLNQLLLNEVLPPIVSLEKMVLVLVSHPTAKFGTRNINTHLFLTPIKTILVNLFMGHLMVAY